MMKYIYFSYFDEKRTSCLKSPLQYVRHKKVNGTPQAQADD